MRDALCTSFVVLCVLVGCRPASYTLRHLSRPAPGFEDLDTITAVALVATF